MPQPITAQNASAGRVFPCSSSHLQADTGPKGCGDLQPHDVVYPVGLSRQAQPGTGASRIEEPVRGASHIRLSPVEWLWWAVRRHCRGAHACRCPAPRGGPGEVRRRAAACGRTRDGRARAGRRRGRAWPSRGELDGDGEAARGAPERGAV